MNHKEALKDYEALRKIAGGGSCDISEEFEHIAEDLLQNPSKKCATKNLKQLIARYFDRGDASGVAIEGSIEAVKIFARHGLIRCDTKQQEPGQ